MGFIPEDDCKLYSRYYQDNDYTDIYDIKSLDFYAIFLSTVAMISLLVVAFSIFCLKDSARVISPHPLTILAQICTL
jgi:hypothetical protein